MGRCEDSFAAHEAGIVDEDCGISEMCFDVVGCTLDLVGRREVTVEVVYIWWRYIYAGRGRKIEMSLSTRVSSGLKKTGMVASFLHTNIFGFLDVQDGNLDAVLS